MIFICELLCVVGSEEYLLERKVGLIWQNKPEKARNMFSAVPIHLFYDSHILRILTLKRNRSGIAFLTQTLYAIES